VVPIWHTETLPGIPDTMIWECMFRPRMVAVTTLLHVCCLICVWYICSRGWKSSVECHPTDFVQDGWCESELGLPL
jgi:hypothetical protein